MRQVMELTWKDIEALDKEHSVLCMTVAPVEEHGYHLPIGTDIYEGNTWTELFATKLGKEGNYICYQYPALTVSSASAHYPYSIHYKPSTTRLVMYETLQGLVGQGWKHIVIIASHGDPIHHVAISMACDHINQEYGVCAFSPMGAFFSLEHSKLDFEVPKHLTELEQKHQDIHAGFVETSSMLDINEDLVKNIYKELPDTNMDERMMSDKDKILEAMGEYGHLGAPQYATKEMGMELNDNVADYLTMAVKAFLQRKDYEPYGHHFLHPYICHAIH